MRYYNVVEDGSRGNGWYQIDGAENLDADGDTDWYYIDDGEIKYADGGAADLATYDDDGAVYVQRIKLKANTSHLMKRSDAGWLTVLQS